MVTVGRGSMQALYIQDVALYKSCIYIGRGTIQALYMYIGRVTIYSLYIQDAALHIPVTTQARSSQVFSTPYKSIYTSPVTKRVDQPTNTQYNQTHKRIVGHNSQKRRREEVMLTLLMVSGIGLPHFLFRENLPSTVSQLHHQDYHEYISMPKLH